MNKVLVCCFGALMLVNCKEHSDGAIDAGLENNKNIFGSYHYFVNDTFRSESSGLQICKYFETRLYLYKDYTFEEVNENGECFANLPDFGGTFEIRDSMVICTINGMLGMKNDSNGRYEIMTFVHIEPNTVKYWIKADTLINLSNRKERLTKTKPNNS